MSRAGRYRGVRVGLLLGGQSSERAVSLQTGRAVGAALAARGYEVVEIDPDGARLPAQLLAARVGVIFIALHGTYGEDGRVQGLLDWMGVPYTGEGLRESLLAFDKVVAKQLFRLAGVPVAEDLVLSPEAAARAAPPPFDGPWVVKPVAEGSSVGVHVVREPEAIAGALRDAARHGPVLVERFVAGPEIAVACFGDEILGSVEVEPLRGFYDYEAKYGGASGTRYHLPPRLPRADLARVEALGLAAHRALGCRGATRVDLRWGQGVPAVLEVNTLPGLTATSLVPKIATARGDAFPEFIERVLDAAACGPAQGGAHVGQSIQE